MITNENETKTMTKHISCDCKCKFNSTTCNSKHLEVRITKYRNRFSKSYTENWSSEISFIDCVLKTKPWDI